MSQSSAVGLGPSDHATTQRAVYMTSASENGVLSAVGLAHVRGDKRLNVHHTRGQGHDETWLNDEAQGLLADGYAEEAGRSLDVRGRQVDFRVFRQPTRWAALGLTGDEYLRLDGQGWDIDTLRLVAVDPQTYEG